MANPTRRVGVVLFQLGGPDTPQAIEPFLFNLFCDPDIIDFPFARIGRKPLAKLISTTRAKKVQHHYSAIGGASPIRRFTQQQADALQGRLRADGIDAHCFVAMRYWHPFTAEAIEQLRAAQVRRSCALASYIRSIPARPPAAVSTNGAGFSVTICRCRRSRLSIVIRFIWMRWSRRSTKRWPGFPNPRCPEIVFSAHSVPVSVIEKGDPYQRQIEETVELVMRRGGWPYRHRLCYQSKVGASKWLQPSLHRTIRDLGAERAREVCVVPIAFVSDHVETLGEIDHEAREEAAALGIQQFEMTSGLNDSPTFIAALADLVVTRDWRRHRSGERCAAAGRGGLNMST